METFTIFEILTFFGVRLNILCTFRVNDIKINTAITEFSFLDFFFSELQSKTLCLWVKYTTCNMFKIVIGLIDGEWLQMDKRIDWQPIVNIYCLQCLFSDTTTFHLLLFRLWSSHENSIKIPFVCYTSTHLSDTVIKMNKWFYYAESQNVLNRFFRFYLCDGISFLLAKMKINSFLSTRNVLLLVYNFFFSLSFEWMLCFYLFTSSWHSSCGTHR